MRAPRDYERQRREAPLLPPLEVERTARDGALWQWREPPPVVTPGQDRPKRPYVAHASIMRPEDVALQRQIKAVVWMLAAQMAPVVFAEAAGTFGTGTVDEFFDVGMYQQGDIAVAFVQTANQAVALNGTNGWKEYTGPGGTTFPIGTGTAGAAASSRLSIFWTRVTNKPSTSDTHLQLTDSGDHTFVYMVIVRDALEYGDPFDTGASGTDPSATTVTIPQVTTSVANCLGLAAITVGGPAYRALSSWGNGFTEIIDTGSTQGVDGTIGVASKTLTSSGATGTVGVTYAAGTTTVSAFGLIAIKPALGTTYKMPQHIGAGALQTSTTGAITYPIPAVVQDYDVIFLRVQSANEAVVLTTAQGFAELTNQGTGTANAAGSTRMTIFWRRVGSGEAGTIGDVVIQASADHLIAGMHVYRYVKRTGDPWDTFAGDVEATGSTSVTFPTITTSVDDCLVLHYGSHGVDTGTGQFGSLTNAALSEKITRSTSSTTNGVGGGQAVYSSWKYTAGAVGTSTTTLITSSKQGRITVALLPEPETDWEEDPTSGKGVPRTLGQWANVLDDALGAHTKLPTSVYTFQEAAHDIRDAISSAVAFADTTGGFTYLSAQTGWSRTGLLFTENSANKLTATVPAADTNSFLCLFYVAIPSTPGASQRKVIEYPRVFAEVNTTPVYQADAGTLVTGAANPGTTVHPVWVRANRTAGTVTVITDQETLSPTDFSSAGTTLTLGASAGSGGAPMRVLYGARWTGSAAEMSDSDINAIMATLGWLITGTGATSASAQTSDADGTVDVSGAATTSSTAQTSAAAGTVDVAGAAATAAGSQASASAGTVDVAATGATSATAQTDAAAGTVDVAGATATQAASQATAAAGAVDVAGAAATASSAQATDADGTVLVQGNAATQASAQVTAATGEVEAGEVTGDGATVAEPQASAAEGTVGVTGTAATQAAPQESLGGDADVDLPVTGAGATTAEPQDTLGFATVSTSGVAATAAGAQSTSGAGTVTTPIPASPPSSGGGGGYYSRMPRVAPKTPPKPKQKPKPKLPDPPLGPVDAVAEITITMEADGAAYDLVVRYTSEGKACDPAKLELRVVMPIVGAATFTYGTSDMRRISPGVYTISIMPEDPGTLTYAWVATFKNPEKTVRTEGSLLLQRADDPDAWMDTLHSMGWADQLKGMATTLRQLANSPKAVAALDDDDEEWLVELRKHLATITHSLRN